MPRRVRTTKALAKRMDLMYFSHPHPLRRWRLYLSVAVPVLALIWFTAQRARGEKVYSSGPLSASHAVFGKNCELCHVTKGGVFHKEVNDSACLSCHDAPGHHPQQVTFTPTCGSCHVEHKGSLRLAHTMDSACGQCHTDLHIKNGELKYVQKISGFDRHHPEFAALRPGATDPGTVKLNHYAHLQPKLAGPSGPVQLTCQDCHRPIAAEGTFPYAMGEIKAVSLSMGDLRRDATSRAYMAPIRYQTQCAGCHVKELQFDARFNEAVPHDKPEVVQAFLVKRYTNYIAQHPNAMSEPLPRELIIAGIPAPLPPPPKTPEEWIKWQVYYADRLLFDKGCKLCHTMVKGDGPVPLVAKSSIPARWMQHATFDHDAHRMLTCTSCHTRSPQSRQTADILIPSIASCRGCHQERGPAHDAADGRCSECHQYHDWRKEQLPKNNVTIQQMRGSVSGM